MGAEEEIRIGGLSVKKSKKKLLSEREEECLRHLARGGTVKCIAEELNLSPRTVEYYLSGAKRKLKRRTREQLIKFYWKYLDAGRWKAGQRTAGKKLKTNELSKSKAQG